MLIIFFVSAVGAGKFVFTHTNRTKQFWLKKKKKKKKKKKIWKQSHQGQQQDLPS